MMKPYILLTAGVAILSVGTLALTWSEDAALAAVPADPPPAEDAAFAVTALASVSTEIRRSILATGRTHPTRQIDLRAEHGGLVMGPALPVGTRIPAGDPVCLLDPGTLPLRLSEAEARLNEARAALETAETLVARGHAPEGNLYDRRAAVLAAEARQAELQREDAKRRIIAPFDGVLTEETPEAGSVLAPMASCATLVALDRLHVTLYLPEAELSSLDTDAPLMAVTTSGRELSATLHAIAPEADPRTGMVAVTVRLENDDRSLRAGEMLSVRFQTTARPAHHIPRSALLLSEDGSLGVRLLDGDRSRFAPAVIVTEDAAGLWVSGLPETARIVTSGQHFLTDTTPIAALLTERL